MAPTQMPNASATLFWLAAIMGADELTEPGPIGQDLRDQTHNGTAYQGPEPQVPLSDDRDAGKPKADTTKLFDIRDDTSLDPTGNIPAYRLSLAGPRPLQGKLELARALRPFRQTVSSRHRWVLDVEGTVRATATTQRMLPIFRPGTERRFSIDLVYDSSPSMTIWDDTLDELASVIEHVGAFRDVTKWRLHTNRDRDEVWLTDHAGQHWAPGLLRATDRRRVILLVTDAVGEHWYTPAIWNCLTDWGSSGPTALIDPLPLKLWSFSGIGPNRVRVRASSSAAPNIELKYNAPRRWRLTGRSAVNVVPIPIVEFAPAALTEWALTVVNADSRGCAALLAESQSSNRMSESPPRNSPSQTGLGNFFHTASPAALRLAVLAATSESTTLDVLRAIQEELLPESVISDLAEVLVSGIYKHVPNHSGEPGLRIRMDAGCRSELQSLASNQDQWDVYRAISAAIARRHPNSVGAFQAAVHDTSGDIAISREQSPFAEAARAALDQARASSPLTASAGFQRGRDRGAVARTTQAGVTEALERLRRARTAKAPPIPFVGAGLSSAVTNGVVQASWRGLLLDGIDLCERVISPLPRGWAGRTKDQLDNADAITYLAVADEIQRRLRAVGGTREVDSWIRRSVGELRPTPEGRQIIEAVRSLGRVIVTTNYDTLIEDLPPKWSSYTWADPRYRTAIGGTKVVLHLRGVVGEPDSIILGSMDHERFSNDLLPQVFDQSLFASNTFIFIGCGGGLNDPDTAPVIDFMNNVMPKKGAEHYILVKGDQLSRFIEHPLSPLISPVAYGSNFDDLLPFLKKLASDEELDVSQDPRFYEHHLAAQSRTALLGLAGGAQEKLQTVLVVLQRAMRAAEQVELSGAVPAGMNERGYADQEAVHQQLAVAVTNSATLLESCSAQVVPAFEDAEVAVWQLTTPKFAKHAAGLVPIIERVAKLEDVSRQLLDRVARARDDLHVRTEVWATDYRIPYETLSRAHAFIDQACSSAILMRQALDRLATKRTLFPGSAEQRPSRDAAPSEHSATAEPGLRLVPVLGKAAAGGSVLAAGEDTEYLPLPTQYGHRDDAFAVKMLGDSMAGDGLLDGDYVVAVPDVPKNGDMAVILVEGEEGEATIKRLWYEGAAIRLESSNSNFHPIIFGPDATPIVQGKVIGVISRHINRDDRPYRLEAGAQGGEELPVELFDDATESSRPMPMTALRKSTPFPLDAALVEECLGPAPIDAVFGRGWRSGPASLTRAERNAVARVTGHMAESVTEVLLDRLGWQVLWHFTGPGRHGVDLLFLAPGDKIVAMEVKGTLVPGRLPRLSYRDMDQMSTSAVDKADNPGMAELVGLQSADVYGGVVIINFADLEWRLGLTPDFSTLIPITKIEQLTNLSWLIQVALR